MLLSLILLSYIVASNREIINTYIYFNYSDIFNLVNVNVIFEDININKPRDKSLLLSLNILFIAYINKIETQSNNFFQFNQTKQKNFQLSYVFSKKRILSNQNETNSSNNSPPTYVKDNIYNINNLDQYCGLSISFISYSNSDSTDLELQDGKFNLIFLFRKIKKSADNVKNIIMFLNYMTSFIDKINLKNYRELNFSYFKSFEQVVWNLLLAVYLTLTLILDLKVQLGQIKNE